MKQLTIDDFSARFQKIPLICCIPQGMQRSVAKQCSHPISRISIEMRPTNIGLHLYRDAERLSGGFSCYRALHLYRDAA